MARCAHAMPRSGHAVLPDAWAAQVRDVCRRRSALSADPFEYSKRYARWLTQLASVERGLASAPGEHAQEEEEEEEEEGRLEAEPPQQGTHGREGTLGCHSHSHSHSGHSHSHAHSHEAAEPIMTAAAAGRGDRDARAGALEP